MQQVVKANEHVNKTPCFYVAAKWSTRGWIRVRWCEPTIVCHVLIISLPVTKKSALVRVTNALRGDLTCQNRVSVYLLESDSPANETGKK